MSAHFFLDANKTAGWRSCAFFGSMPCAKNMIYAAHILLLISLAYMVLLGYAFSRPRNAATFWFMVMLVCSTAWAVSYYLELMTPTVEGKMAVKLARFVFLPWLPMAWLLMTAKLFHIGTWIPRGFWWGVSILNTVGIALAFTSEQHGLFLTHTGIHAYGPLGILTFHQGPWYRFHNLYLNLLALFGLVLMVVAWFKAHGARRRDLGLMILGFSVPLATNIVFAIGKSPLRDVNLAPFTMVLSISVYAWEVLRHRMLDLVPLARNTLLDHLPDLVLVADTHEQIVDMNEACVRAIGRPLSTCIGQPTDSLPLPWGKSLAQESGMMEAEIEGQWHWFDLARMEIRDAEGTRVGSLRVWRDVTQRHQAEEDRLELERIRADARLVNQQKQLLRDMHDGLGGIAANISLLANLGQQETDLVAKDGVLGKIETLAVEGNAEIRSLMNAMENREFIWTDWLLEIRKFGQAACAGRSMEFESTIEGVPPGDSLSLMAGISMFRMLKEAVTNAVKHSGASRLDMRLRFSPQGFEAVVQDNGNGFDAEKSRPGRGLTSIRKRAEELGGEMNGSSVGGTRCRFWIPLPIKYPVDEIALPDSFPPS